MTPLHEIIEQEYRACGFAAAGALPFIGPVEEDREHLSQWIRNGYAGSLDYMNRSEPYRHDLRRLMPGVRSLVVTLTSYNRGDLRQPAGVPRIARYAWSEDYHTVVKRNLNRLLARIRSYDRYAEVEGRAVADSAPAFEKAWAMRAGLGWRGRNSLLIHPDLGSYVIIGLLLLDCELPAEFPPLLTDGCEDCDKCLRGCPAGAIVNEQGTRTIDARRCLSAFTTTGKPVEPAHREALRGRIWGCDHCQEACPYNRTATAIEAGKSSPLTEHPEWMDVTREEWLAMTEAEYRERFKGSVLDKKGLERIKSLL